MKSFALSALVLASAVLAHNEPSKPLSRREAMIRRAQDVERRNALLKCSGALKDYQNQRREVHEMRRRGESLPEGQALPKLPAEDKKPKYKPQPWYYPDYTSTIHNSTVVLTPEVEEGPYYVKNELIRKDLRGGQAGVPVTLDIGIVDVRSCKPVPNAFIDIWGANATGDYSTFTNVTEFGLFPNKTDELNWLRGGYPTGPGGVVEFTTVYPGFYPLRTIHYHIGVHTNWTQNANGTIQSDSGNFNWLGQVYYEESLNNEVLREYPYNTNDNERTFNNQDFDFAHSNAKGAKSTIDVVRLGKNITQDGILGFLTIGIDLEHIHSGTWTNKWNSTNYWTPYSI